MWQALLVAQLRLAYSYYYLLNKVKIIHFDIIDSTNAYLKKEYASFDNLTIVEASHQTNGKGRMDRIWDDNPNENLLFSILVKDKKLLEAFNHLSIFSAAIIAKTLISLGINGVSVKWPNDVYVNNKKICGILLEGSLPNYLVIGIGINVNQIEFADTLRTPATSIALELNQSINLIDLKNKIYTDFARFLNNLNLYKNELNTFLNEHNYLKNKIISVNNDVGKVIGFDDNNYLVINVDGEIKIISSNEINVID